MDEIWKEIDGFNERYWVSSSGNVKSVYKTRPEKILKQMTNKCGYKSISIYDNNRKIKIATVHRLVAIAFLDNPNNKPMVNHIDANKTNNKLENLEWCTSSENIKHAYSMGLMDNKGSKHPRAKINEKTVIAIKADILSGMRNIDISGKYKVHKDTVSNIKRNKQWKHV